MVMVMVMFIGMLSHAAVVSRECGVPAVVQCTGVLRGIVSGQRVIVDGERGYISIVTDDPPATTPVV
jgi:phosphoenolpyruvate-protein kinase (PTS system EI component)